MFDWLNDPSAWAALLTLTLLEIVLGIDNIVFISILVDKLPESLRKKARFIGLALAMVMRLLLLFTLKWIMGLIDPIMHIPIHPALHDPLFGPEVTAKLISSGGMLGISIKDLILLGGGLFLIWKSTKEIHHKFEGAEENSNAAKKAVSFGAVLAQIAMIDIIFSLDSVITAVGMAKDLSVMALAVIISVVVMMLSAGTISTFVSKHPSVKMLALSFLILIGTALMAEGLHFHIPKGYIYFAMAFSLGVEVLNLKLRSKGRSTPSPNL